MQPRTEVQKPTVATILSRALEMKGGGIPLEGAKFILDLSIRDEDNKRMLELMARNQEAAITAEEAEELQSYMQANSVLSILKARALIAVKQAGGGS